MTRNPGSLSRSHERRPRFGRVYGGLLGAMAAFLSTAATGCLDRPVTPATPRTSNTLTAQVSVTAVDKIDLLFAIDNSSSMLDKQIILSKAIGDLVGRLVNPVCVDANGAPTDQPANTTDKCTTAGSVREFNAIDDIHIGVVSSSLGGMGSDSCAFTGSAPNATNNTTKDDHGHLLNRLGPHADGDYTYAATVPTYANAAGATDNFLAWDPSSAKGATFAKNPGTGMETDSMALVQKFQQIVQGVDQAGCGFEQQMEGWYRFLADPSPPQTITQTDQRQPPTIAGPDPVILQQRADFLRPDSLVAVIVVSDENEHSIILGSLPSSVCEQPTFDASGAVTGCAVAQTAWPDSYHVSENYDASGGPMQFNYASLQLADEGAGMFPSKSGTTACDTDPLSPDCKECFTQAGPGCHDYPAADVNLDLDLRQWDMKRRFGWDAEYPAQRYIDALHEPNIYNYDGYKVPNPLFDDLPYNAEKAAGKTPNRAKATPRDPKLIFLAGIVGVPWQDIARTDAHGKPDLNLGYKTATDSDVNQRIDWDLILGDPHNPDITKRDPGDPLMIEAQDRTAAIAKTPNHPVTKEPLGPSTWNSINGHEWNAKDAHDLQYTCFVALPQPDNCLTASGSCDCTDPSSANPPDPAALQKLNNPLCEPLTVPSDPTSPGAGQAQIKGDNAFKQFRAHAYSGRRYMEILKGLSLAGGNSIVASICARNVAFDDANHQNDADLGYRPAVSAIIDQLKTQLKGRCLPRKLEPNPDGSTPCLIIAARYPVADKTVPAATVQECKKCDSTARTKIPAEIASVLTGDVTSYQCQCEITQLKGDDLKQCTTSQSASLSGTDGGWCYVDPDAFTNPADKAGAETIVSKCPSNQHQTIRFLNADTNDATIFITCLGAASGGQAASGTGGTTGAAGSGG